MSKIKLEAGQWYRNREGTICYCVGPLKREADRFMVETDNGLCDEFEGNGLACKTIDQDDDDEWKHLDLIEHLPDCTGFDWEPPKRPDAPSGWRWLEDDEPTEIGDNYWAKENPRIPDLVSGKGRKWKELKLTRLGNIVWGIIRKIEPKYRPFKWEERDRIRGKWIQFVSGGRNIELLCTSITQNTNESFGVAGYRNEWLFENAKFLDDSPFGICVDD